MNPVNPVFVKILAGLAPTVAMFTVAGISSTIEKAKNAKKPLGQRLAEAKLAVASLEAETAYKEEQALLGRYRHEALEAARKAEAADAYDETERKIAAAAEMLRSCGYSVSPAAKNGKAERAPAAAPVRGPE
jgi:hypothetical protein